MRLRCTLLPFFFLACAACGQPQAVRNDTAVLRAALDPTCSNASVSVAVISDAMPARVDHSLPRKWSVAWRYGPRLWLSPPSSGAWQTGPLCANVRVVSHHDIEAALVAEPRVAPDWKGFHDTFVGARGYSAYSRPIYAADGKHALIFTDHHCEGHCGLGEVLELELADGRWRIARTALTWIS